MGDVFLTVLLAFSTPIVIGHRGACGLRPEHTLASYQLAIEQGADVVEPDLVPTKDGVLVCRHENEISGTTNVADHPEFANRKATKTIDGEKLTGWFTEDFTLAELKTLRAKERLPKLRPNNTKFDGQFEVPTFAELLQLVKRHQHAGRSLGVYPETKHPTYFRSIGLASEPLVVATLRKEGVIGAEFPARAQFPIYLQSFEPSSLRELRAKLGRASDSKIYLVQLTDASGTPADGEKPFAYWNSAEGLAEIKTFADGVGPDKSVIVPRVNDRFGVPTDFIKNAHANGLLVHPYTFRAESYFFPKGGTIQEELTLFIRAGVDGFFTDFPEIGRQVVAKGN